MLAPRLAQPAPSSPARSPSPTSAAGLPTAMRQAWAYLWWSVRTHMAELHGLRRPDLTL
jgi:hypothetical protein